LEHQLRSRDKSRLDTGVCCPMGQRTSDVPFCHIWLVRKDFRLLSATEFKKPQTTVIPLVISIFAAKTRRKSLNFQRWAVSV
jgi:hypothetical protein